jgi:putative MATE family efflux protein
VQLVDDTKDEPKDEPKDELKDEPIEELSEQERLAKRRAEMEGQSEAEMTKKVFNIAWPATVEAILQTTIRMVTSSLLGNIPGQAALAVSASGLADRITRLSWGIFAAVGTGSTVMVARSIGAGEQQRANRFAEQALVLGAILILTVTTVLLLFTEELIWFFYNQDGSLAEDLYRMTIDYLRYTAWGVPLMSINQIIGALMRGAGNTRVTMVTNTAANITNAFLGFCLIYGNFGFPEMGITGAAVATVISQGVGAVMAIIIFIKFQTNISVSFARFRMLWRDVFEIFVIGIPHASEMLLMQFGQIALGGLIGSMGVIELAAHNQGLTAESLSFMPAMGFGIAATALVGQSIGVGSVTLAQKYVKVLAKWNMMLTAVTASMLILIPRQIFSLLTYDTDVIALGSRYLIIMGFVQIPQQLTAVFSGALRGGGDGRATLLNSLLGLWCIRIPFSFIMGSSLTVFGVTIGFNLGIMGVWYAMAVDLLVRFTVASLRYRQGVWKKTAYRIAGEQEKIG